MRRMVLNNSVAGSEKPMKQLVIIGNGFDLRCGLSSSFSDFHRDRSRYFSNEENRGEEDSSRYTLTIWDTILSNSTQMGWADIEGEIANWISPRWSPLPTPDNESDLLSPQWSPTGCVEDVVQAIKLNNLYLGEKLYGTASAVACSVERLVEQYGQQCSRQQVFDFFFRELRILENDFKAYMNRQVITHAEYNTKANSLLFTILSDGIPSHDMSNADYGVLSFNYTRAAENYQVGTAGERRQIWYCNIHGRLTDEIIFGIDAMNHLEDLDVAQFTKTYRVLGLRSGGYRDGFSDEGSAIDQEISTIKFFGHSLGDADHSYFQSIFDIVHLYEGSAKLIFYYCPYKKADGGEVSESQARNEMTAKVLKLLNSYGKSLDNEYHGTNLVHKMMLEDRIAIRLLPKLEWRAVE